MKRSTIILFVSLTLLFSAVEGCATSSMGTGSFWSSERGASVNDSLDQHGTRVARLEREANELKREVE